MKKHLLNKHKIVIIFYSQAKKEHIYKLYHKIAKTCFAFRWKQIKGKKNLESPHLAGRPQFAYPCFKAIIWQKPGNAL